MIARNVLAQFPGQPDALNLLGLVSMRHGALEQALQYFAKGLQKSPGHPHLLNNAGLAEKNMNHLEKAEAHFVKATKTNPSFVYARNNLARVYQAQRKFARAERQYREIIQQQPNYVDALANLSNILEARHQTEEAAEFASRALSIDPDNYMARLTLANIAQRNHDYEEMIRLLTPPLQSQKLSRVNLAVLGGKCAYAYEKLGDYGQAFTHYLEANQVLHDHYAPGLSMPDGVYDPEAVRRIELRVPSFPFAEAAYEGKAPVFLVGFPRSGTTLLDQILSSHSAITVLEEKPYLADILGRFPATDGGLTALENAGEKEMDKLRRAYWAGVKRDLGPGARAVVIDKLPLNAVALLHISRLFPGAKIITALRDPRDCVFSCFQQRFGMNRAMFELLRLDTAVSYYDRVMNVISAVHDAGAFDMHFIRYEQVIRDFDGEIGALIDFLGLEWEDALRDYQATARSRDISTPSASQVIQPLYTTSIGKWEHYREWIGDVFWPLDRWAEKWGYTSAHSDFQDS